MIDYDIHIHTHLSSCGDRKAFISDYARIAEAKGLTLIGFSDHAWDRKIAGATPWYSDQDYDRLIQRREDVKALETKNLVVKLGAEGEYANYLLGLSDYGAQFVDYIIVPHSHTHMKGFVLPSDCDTPKKHAEYLYKSFIALCRHEKRSLFFGIAHPLFPVGQDFDSVNEILSYIDENTLHECMSAAKEAGLFFELNLSCFMHYTDEQIQRSLYTKIIRTALADGVSLFFGTDSHSCKVFSASHDAKERIISEIGVPESAFTAAKLRILNA